MDTARHMYNEWSRSTGLNYGDSGGGDASIMPRARTASATR